MAKKFKFKEEKVRVRVPDQSNGKKIKPKKLPFGKIEEMPGKPGKFHPNRGVINVVFTPEDAPDTILEEFDPPVQLRVRYRKKDLKALEEGEELRLAFWNGTEWIEFTEEKHNFRLKPKSNPKKGGWGIAEIKHWGDPPVSWGKRS